MSPSSSRDGIDTINLNILNAVVVILVIVLGSCLLLRIIDVGLQIYRSRKRRRKSRGLSLMMNRDEVVVSYPLKTMVVLGSGGHTTEMLSMIRPLDPKLFHPILFVKAQTDTTSLQRLKHQRMILSANDNNNNRSNDDDTTAPLVVFDIPRSREVGQSYFTSIFTTLRSFVTCAGLVLYHRPRIVLCNGPGTCLPVAIAGLLLGKFLGIFPITLVFVESFCRVDTLSLTGKIMYWIADLFVLHWQELHDKYPFSVLAFQFLAPTSKTAAQSPTTTTNL